MRTFKTAKGTELPIISLKGKDYLEVKYRLVWFREEKPNWGIETEYLEISDKGATARAVIKDETGRIVATSHKTETIGGFGDFIEKSETGAIGRALALIGYGTQFCADELDEGERVVDSPVPPKSKAPLKAVPADPNDIGAYVLTFGKFRGMRLDAVGPHDLNNYVNWIREEAKKKNKEIQGDTLGAVQAIDLFLESRQVERAK